MSSVFRGVDLGSHHSCCASSFTTDGYTISVDVNDLANRSTPSLLSIDSNNKTRLIGEEAESQISRNPKQTYTYLIPAFLSGVSDEEDKKFQELKQKFQWAWVEPDTEENKIEFGTTSSTGYTLDKTHLFGTFLKKLLSLRHIKGAEKQEKVVLAIPDAYLGNINEKETDSESESDSTKKSKEKLYSMISKSLKLANYDRTIENVELALTSECLSTQWIHKYKDRILEAATSTVASKTRVMIVDVGYTQTTAFLVEVGTKKPEEKKSSESESETNEATVGNEESEISDETKSPSKTAVAAAAAAAAPSTTDNTTEVPVIAAQIIAKQTSTVGVFDFINQLAQFGVDYAKTKYKKDVKLESKQGYKLKTAMQKALKELSMLPESSVGLECFFEDESDFLMDLKREQLEVAVAPVLEKVKACVQAMYEKHLEMKSLEGQSNTSGSENNVDNNSGDVEMTNSNSNSNSNFTLPSFSVEIVGGGVRIPCVASTIAQAAGINLNDDEKTTGLRRGLDGSSAVSTGACLVAAGVGYLEKRMLEGFDITKLNLESDSSLQKSLAIESELEEIESIEKTRQDAINQFESYIYEARSFISPGAESKAHFDDVQEIEKTIDEAESWFFDSMDKAASASPDDILPAEAYTTKYNELKSLILDKGAKWFEILKEKEAKLQAELEAAHALKKDEEKEDHDSRKLPNSERLRMAEKQRLEGNELFKSGTSYSEAIGRYIKAQGQLGKLFDLSPEDVEEKNRIALSCYLNTAQCYMKGAEKETNKDKIEQIYKKVIGACDSALEIDSKSIKALFRKASGLEKIGDIDKARKTCQLALTVDEKNSELIRLDKVLERAQLLQKKKESKMYGKMFG